VHVVHGSAILQRPAGTLRKDAVGVHIHAAYERDQSIIAIDDENLLMVGTDIEVASIEDCLSRRERIDVGALCANRRFPLFPIVG
jgi:hypothetical protein